MERLTWFGKFLITAILVAVSAVFVMFATPIVGLGSITYLQALGMTGVARVLPSVAW